MKKSIALSIVSILCAASALTYCQAAPSDKYDPATISQSKDLTTSPSGLKYCDEVVGKGAGARPGQTVIVHYTGWLTNGSKFDSSLDRNEPFKFTLGQGQVIKGWDEGVASMKVGGKRHLVIPAKLGYGPGGMPPTIPPNSTLVFDVQLLSIQ